MTPALHRIALGFGLTLALATPSAVAQTKPEPAATAKAAPPGGFSPLGDPSRFTRMGGWGGIGAGMAQFGLAKAMMINMPAVQKELKLTEDQVKQIREWSDGLRKRGESLFRRQAEAGNAADAGNGNGNGNPAPPDVPQGQPGGPPNPLAMLDMISTITREGEAGLAKILNKGQRTRLEQIALQMEGVSALARPEVAESIYLSPEQVEEIQQILAGAKTQQIGHFLRQGLAMRGRRGPDANAGGPAPFAGGDRPAPRPTEAKKADAEPEDPEAQAKRRQAERQRRQSEFSKLREGSDQIQDAATAKILRVLARKQRERFDKLLGEPFDPAKLNGAGGFGGPPRPDGESPPDARPADAPKPAAPTPPRSSRLRDSRFKGEPKSPQP